MHMHLVYVNYGTTLVIFNNEGVQIRQYHMHSICTSNYAYASCPHCCRDYGNDLSKPARNPGTNDGVLSQSLVCSSSTLL